MSAPAVEKKLTAHDLATEIRARYEAPEWHVEPEVTLAGRRLDLVALNMWAARDYRIVGFELKVNRGDWMRELSAFQKSEDWCAVVDAFYVVTTPNVIRADELPDGWGHLELVGSRMMTRRHATTRTGAQTIPREVAARFIGRLAQDAVRKDRQAEWAAKDELREEIEKRARESIAKESAEASRRVAEIEREYHELLNALGVRSRDWEHHKAAMRAAGVFASTTQGSNQLRRRLEMAATDMESHALNMRQAIALLDVAPPSPELT